MRAIACVIGADAFYGAEKKLLKIIVKCRRMYYNDRKRKSMSFVFLEVTIWNILKKKLLAV